MKIIPHDPKELIAVVDDENKIIGKATRKAVHKKGLLHREASLFIVNENNEILIQTRKDNGKYDYSASGHFPAEDTYLDGAVREVKEELGSKLNKNEFNKIAEIRVDFKSSEKINNRFIDLFEVKGNFKITDFKIDKNEVKNIKFIPISEIKKLIDNKSDLISEGFDKAFKTYCKVKGL